MFKPTKNFNWKVTFEWPENEQFVKHSIRCTFERLSTTEMEDLNKEIPPADDNNPAGFLTWIHRTLDRILKGVNMEDIQLTNNTTGEPMTHDETMDWCKADPTISVAMYECYQQAITGRKVELGNSEPQPSSSQDSTDQPPSS